MLCAYPDAVFENDVILATKWASGYTYSQKYTKYEMRLGDFHRNITHFYMTSNAGIVYLHI